MKSIILIICISSGVLNSIAQNIGVNSTGALPHTSAILDVDASPSNNKGFLMPRLSSVERKSIISPAIGLEVYDVSLKGHYTFDGIKWDCSDNPAGTVNYFANITAPNGFLECNGQAVNRTTYAELFSAIVTLYGVGDGSTTFNVPDLRGEFIRGWDNGRGADATRAIATWQVGTAFIGDGDGLNLPVANLNSTAQKTVMGWDDDTAPVNSTAITINYTAGPSGSCSIDGAHSTGTVGICTNFARSRPRNIALMPCIKF